MMAPLAVRQRAKRLLQAVGYYRHRLEIDPYPGVVVLAYHGVPADGAPPMHAADLHVSASLFEEHCYVLRELGCRVLRLDEWLGIASGLRPAPPLAVLLTFDDGYRSVFSEALPILERYEFPATVFITTGPVDRGERFWFDAVAARHGAAAVADAKSWPHDRWRALVEGSRMCADPGDPHAPMSADDVCGLARHPLIAIGSHTVTHPVLANAPADVQADEVQQAQRTLEGWVGIAPTAFAYPNGRPGLDYNGTTIDVLAASGIGAAFTTAEGFAGARHPGLEQPRFVMVSGVDGPELAHRLTLSWVRPRSTA